MAAEMGVSEATVRRVWRAHGPKPFIWTAKANDILEKVKRARKSLNNTQSV